MSAPVRFNSEEFGTTGSWGVGYPLPGLANLLEVHGFSNNASACYFGLVVSSAAPVVGAALREPLFIPAGGGEFSWVPYAQGWPIDGSAFFSWVCSSTRDVWTQVPGLSLYVSATLAMNGI